MKISVLPCLGPMGSMGGVCEAWSSISRNATQSLRACRPGDHPFKLVGKPDVKDGWPIASFKNCLEDAFWKSKAQVEFGGAMKELIEHIARALVDNPEQVSVRPIEGEQSTVFELRVAQSDLGKVIGKEGRTASSIRNILSAAGMKLKKRFTLEILE